MYWLRNLKNNRSAWRTLMVLLLGFLMIQIAGIYSAALYLQRDRYQIPRPQFVRVVTRSIRMLNTLPIEFLQTHLNLLVQDGLNSLSFVEAPVPQSVIITNTDFKSLRDMAMRHYYSFKASYQLRDGQWVYMSGGVHKSPYALVGWLISEIFLLMLLLLLCLWVVQRLVIPVVEFERASKRFGIDVQAPPMAIFGTPEMQAVIHSFNEMQGRIRRLILDRTQMLAAISHDLRTPITRLQLRIEALQGTPQYQHAEADLREMERMIASILSFARDYVQSEPMERFDLNALTEQICHELEDTGLDIHCDSQLVRLPYFGRMIALKRALTNLFENAVKYGERAEVSIDVLPQVVKIKIRDHGPGIPDAQMEKVFLPFYRIDSSRTPEKSGSGLGMAVARDIIRAHGGDIALYNHEQGGLLVLITLPLE